MNGRLHFPAALPSRNDPLYPMYMRVNESQRLSDRVKNPNLVRLLCLEIQIKILNVTVLEL
jgi:hypothetical protein